MYPTLIYFQPEEDKKKKSRRERQVSDEQAEIKARLQKSDWKSKLEKSMGDENRFKKAERERLV